MNHFVQNKSKATKALEDRMKKRKLDKIIVNFKLTFKVQKIKTKTMDAILSIVPSRTFVQNVIPIKNTVLQKSAKAVGKSFLVKF